MVRSWEEGNTGWVGTAVDEGGGLERGALHYFKKPVPRDTEGEVRRRRMNGERLRATKGGGGEIRGGRKGNTTLGDESPARDLIRRLV